MTKTVKVSKKFQIAVPAEARERLKIREGDRLLVDIQDGMLILLPVPKNTTAALAGLHAETWGEADGSAFLSGKGQEWDSSNA